MTPAMQIALTATPLAVYFYTLGVFHSGKRPRMVGGPVDVGMLAFGLGGLVAFGPFGRAVLGRIVGGDASNVAWALWIGVVGLWAVILSAAASLRLTIYHVDAEELERAVVEALGDLGGQFKPTLHGFEDPARKAGVTLKSSRWLRSGAVEAYGRKPDELIRELKPILHNILAGLAQRPSKVSHAMFGLACVTMLVPVYGYILANPRAKDALHKFMQSLRWW